MTAATEYSLAELMIAAASEAWRGNGEILASGIGPLARLGASIAKLTHTPELMLTDGEAFLMEDPVPIGPRGDYQPKAAGYLPFSRVFDCVWSGKRHAMTMPTQIDRWGQSNLSCIGDYHRPKVQQLGVRGLPGNSINHINSLMVVAHSPRVFVSDEVDMVGSVGFNPARWPEGVKRDFVDLRLIVTNLCVMDFGGANNAIRVTSLHPGVSFDDVQAATGFPLVAVDGLGTTPAPTMSQMELIARLDPTGVRKTLFKGDPSGRPAVRA